jgi:hypothetical protein
MSSAQNGKTEVDEGDAAAEEAGAVVAVAAGVVVLAVFLPRTSGSGNQMLMNTGEKDVVVMMESITGADHPIVAVVSREEGGDAGAMDRTLTMVMDDLLLTTGPTRSRRLRHRIPLTRHHLSLLHHRTHNLPRPHPCMRLRL